MNPDFESLYREYVKDRLGAEIVLMPDGFVQYNTHEETRTLFIHNIHVKKDSRRKGICHALVGELEKVVKEKNLDRIVGEIFLFDPHARQTILIALVMGFDIMSADGGKITIVKYCGGNHG